MEIGRAGLLAEDEFTDIEIEEMCRQWGCDRQNWDFVGSGRQFLRASGKWTGCLIFVENVFLKHQASFYQNQRCSLKRGFLFFVFFCLAFHKIEALHLALQLSNSFLANFNFIYLRKKIFWVYVSYFRLVIFSCALAQRLETASSIAFAKWIISNYDVFSFQFKIPTVGDAYIREPGIDIARNHIWSSLLILPYYLWLSNAGATAV